VLVTQDTGAGQLKSAVAQIANLALSFGSEYSSGFLTYGRKH